MMKSFVELARDIFYAIIFHLAPRFANVLIFILIGRWANATMAGVFTLAATYLLIFTTVMRGLDELLVRQVARESDAASHYLGNFIVLRLFLGVPLQLLLLAVVALFNYAPETTRAIVILSLSLIPDSLTFVSQSVLLAERRFASSATILGTISLLKLAGGIVILHGGGSVAMIAWVWVGGSLLGLTAMLLLAVRQVGGLRRADWLDLGLLRRHRRTALSFLALTTLTTLESQTDTVLLSGFLDETAVGWYGAATTIAFSLIMFSQAYRFAVFPMMTRYALDAPHQLRALYAQSIRFLGLIILPMVAGIILLAPAFVPLIFGPSFDPTITILRIIMLSPLLVFLNEPNIRMLLVHDHQSRIALFLLLSAITNITLNLLLIPLLGANGAALARVASVFLLFVLSYVTVYRQIMAVTLAPLLARSTLATLVMIAVLWPIRQWPVGLLVAVGALVYGLAVLGVGAISRDELRLLLRAWRRKDLATDIEPHNQV